MTKAKKLARRLTALLCAVLLAAALPVAARADMGPKPSVRIRFENLGDAPCYGTLLASQKSTGPASAWDGTAEDARHGDNPDYSYKTFGYEVWQAFEGFAGQDDFYFLQEAWRVDETKELAWTYYPPSEFKILLYFPQSGEFAVSGVYERYAFDSYYTVNMSDVTRFGHNGGASPAERFEARRSYDYTAEIISFAARVAATILIEMAVALLFGFRQKKQLLLLVWVNTATQIGLNVLLSLIDYNAGALAFVVFYILLEAVVFVMEAILYCTAMKQLSQNKKANWFYVLYALAANAASFGAGVMVAKTLPGIF